MECCWSGRDGSEALEEVDEGARLGHVELWDVFLLFEVFVSDRVIFPVGDLIAVVEMVGMLRVIFVRVGDFVVDW